MGNGNGNGNGNGDSNLLAIQLTDQEIKRAMSVEVTKDDLISYNVSKVEDKLEDERKEKEDALRKIREAIAKLEQSFKDMVEKTGKADVAAEVKAINDAMAKLGIKNQLEITSQVGEEEKKKVISISVKLKKDSEYSSFEEDVRDIPFTKELKDLEADIDGKRDEATELINRIAEIRNTLANMSRMERKAKANLVEKLLASNAKTRALLDSKK